MASVRKLMGDGLAWERITVAFIMFSVLIVLVVGVFFLDVVVYKEHFFNPQEYELLWDLSNTALELDALVTVSHTALPVR
eukprot:13670201-Heterocapsa_arctica.AAC.1